LQHDGAKRRAGLQLLEKTRAGSERVEDPAIPLNRAKALQSLGRHSEAIHLLESLGKLAEIRLDQFRLLTLAASMAQLGRIGEASSMLGQLLPQALAGEDKLLAAGACLEASRIYGIAGLQTERHRWATRAAELYETLGDVEHWARATSNAGGALLHYNGAVQQAEGVALLQAMLKAKYRIGDFEGMATNHCMLGLYFRRHGNYEGALAHFRKDLTLSRRVGDEQAIATTLLNLADIYIEMFQISKSRRCIAEASELAGQLCDPMLQRRVSEISSKLKITAPRIGKERLGEGAIATCACKSGKVFKDCCGHADVEHPIDEHPMIGGISEDAEAIHRMFEAQGLKPSRLDFMLRDTEQTQSRLSWTEWDIRPGWRRIREMPDMTNHHLNSARAMAKMAHEAPDAFHLPLACALLSVSATEAFINTVIFFAHEEHQRDPSALTLPAELVTDPYAYQRNAFLRVKWFAMAEALCGPGWLAGDRWDAFNRLVDVRNELVHFKALEFETVVPQSPDPHPILKPLPNTVQLRDVPHSWPVRLLTPSFAQWCVDTVDGLISHFKSGYARLRLPSSAESQLRAPLRSVEER
jgi:tetratricopeptide (TPR) repeat protein